jgi:pyruvate/2-oxoglutarate dehydrogenase complex dihydrolipoamide acyltransferase (E2) component
VLAVRVSDGDSVSAGDVLVVLESMKMELEVVAPADGTVERLAVQAGDRVSGGQALVAIGAPVSAQRATTPGRALAIEDYYRIQTVGGPSMSPSGQWVVYTVSTRVEDDNTTRTETQLVRSDGVAQPQRVLHYGRDVSNPSWSPEGWLIYTVNREHWKVEPGKGAPPVKTQPLPAGAVLSPDGRWIASLRDKTITKTTAPAESEFERRHEERFKGVTFDWKDFQRDGQPFPAPNLRARPSAQLVIAPVADRCRRQADRTRLASEQLAPDLHRRSRLAQRVDV